MGDQAAKPGDPREVEKRLAAAVILGDENLVERELAAIGPSNIEFTGRCYAAAITGGLVRATVLFGRAGFHLNVMDEPAVIAELATSAGGMRGLVGFMERYRYCRAQRTYYLPVVQSAASVAPIRALLEEGVGLSERDKSELLSLAVRQDNVELARALVDGGAQLYGDIHDAAPRDLQGMTSIAPTENPWADQLSPRCSQAMIAFILEQLGESPCPVRADWFKLYFRDPQFGAKLALIAPHSTRERCEAPGQLLEVLAREGYARSAAAVLDWGGFAAETLDPALEAARNAGHVEIAADILKAKQAAATPLAPLDFLEF